MHLKLSILSGHDQIYNVAHNLNCTATLRVSIFQLLRFALPVLLIL